MPATAPAILALGSIGPGELAALATAVCWTTSALFFTAAARRLGSLILNPIRLVLALGFSAVYTVVVRGLPLPTDAAAHQWFWLGLSGLVGFFLGDLCLFRALVLLGPRLTMLVMSLWPAIAAVLSWVLLGEGMTGLGVAGMVLTLAGVAWVVAERRPAALDGQPHRVPWTGVALALGAAAGQAGGLVLGKMGMAGYDPFAAAQIRMIAAIAAFLLLILALGAWPRFEAARRHPSSVGLAAAGAMVGPFLGVSLSLLAIRTAPVGVAATIMSLVPVLIIPFAAVIYKDRVGWRAVLGAAVAVAGIALLFA